MELPPMHTLLCSSLISLTIVSQSMSATALLGNETDYLALLAFKDGITDDPLAALASWNDTLHFCQWKGVTCSSRHPQRVAALNLTGQRLTGSLTPYLGNLTFLRTIDMQINNIHGAMPQQFGSLRRLQHINFANNSLGGEIPANLTRCLELRYMDFTANRLVGKIPDLTPLSKLDTLFLSINSLTGTIPASLGNLSSLIYIYLLSNSVEGSIPSELGKLANLEKFQISANKLSGVIPLSLYNLSSITYFGVAVNGQLNGSLPADLGEYIFPRLETFLGAANQFTGPIPTSLANASQLRVIDLGGNYLSGSLPVNMGNLQNLRWLGLAHNRLGSKEGDDLSIITSLTNCSSLQVLDLSNNTLGGALPQSIANFSSQFMDLRLGMNEIVGSIPTGVQNLINLIYLGMEGNFLNASIPIGIGKLNMLEELHLYGNLLSGRIPSSIGNLTRLSRLYLQRNGLEGQIPVGLGDCKNLQVLYLHENDINGTIPKQILSFVALSHFTISNNSLTGSIPQEVGNLKNLGVFDLSDNKLSGEIPLTLGDCLSLEYLYMGGNLFQGSIPLALSSLKGIQQLDLSRNKLSGQIPKFMGQLPLQCLNLSFNDLEGEVPTEGIFRNDSKMSVAGNSKLCGGLRILNLTACHSEVSEKRRISLLLVIIISVISVSLCLILSVCLFAVVRRTRKSRTMALSPEEDHNIKVSYSELLKATDGFSWANFIGEGSYSYVYKGILGHDETVVAVKVLKLHQRGASRSFEAECKALRNIRHRNLVKIITSCSSIDFKGNDFKALIYEYIANGSLDAWLHPYGDRPRLSSLSLTQRLNIALDVAFTLDYLHHQCQTTVIHRDLKPSNVLLDNGMVAHVSDFGLARFLSEDAKSSPQIGSRTVEIKGSIGYIAPEYGMGGGASTHGDMYSYGILLLEMITGKRPTDDMFKEGLSLRQHCEMALPERVIEIADPQLLMEEDYISPIEDDSHESARLHECLASAIRIGVLCSAKSPRERMGIKDVIVGILRTIESFHGSRMNVINKG